MDEIKYIDFPTACNRVAEALERIGDAGSPADGRNLETLFHLAGIQVVWRGCLTSQAHDYDVRREQGWNRKAETSKPRVWLTDSVNEVGIVVTDRPREQAQSRRLERKG